jgi:hypothetical protein
MGIEKKEKLEKRWKKFQEHLGCTDEELAIHRANPKHVKAMESAPAFVKYKMVIEVIEAHNCGAGHKVGDKFVVDAGGCLVPDECPPGRISNVASILRQFYGCFPGHGSLLGCWYPSGRMGRSYDENTRSAKRHEGQLLESQETRGEGLLL